MEFSFNIICSFLHIYSTHFLNNSDFNEDTQYFRISFLFTIIILKYYIQPVCFFFVSIGCLNYLHETILLTAIFFLSFSSATLLAQNDIYFQSINYTDINLRGPVTVLGTINHDFPSDGYVVVHFDGLCYASAGDRVILAASNNGNWDSNDGNVGIESSQNDFARSFSHTRFYPVTAGNHTFYAVGQNIVKKGGSGIASIYGSLTVEYFPDTSPTRVTSGGFVFNGDVTNSTVVSQQTIHARWSRENGGKV